MQAARCRSPSCVIQEVLDGHEEQLTAFGSPVDTAMRTGFGSPVNTASAPPRADYVMAPYMPASGSSFGGTAGIISDSRFAPQCMTNELLAASTAAANTDAQLGMDAQIAGIRCIWSKLSIIVGSSSEGRQEVTLPGSCCELPCCIHFFSMCKTVVRLPLKTNTCMSERLMSST